MVRRLKVRCPKVLALGRVSPESFLTKVVLAKSRRLDYDNKIRFTRWMESTVTEHLPEGVPYKISNHPLVRESGGMFVYGLNKPFLIVADYLSPTERQAVARHEFVEWMRLGSAEKGHSVHLLVQGATGKIKADELVRLLKINNYAHNDAVRQDNKKLRKSVFAKLKKYAEEDAERAPSF